MPAKLEFRYKPQGRTLERFHQSPAAVRFIRGPLGSGKTNACIAEAFMRICRQEPNQYGMRRSRVAITRNTYPDLEETTIRDWLEVVPERLGKMVRGHPPEHQLRFALPDGTKVHADAVFIALDRPDHVKKLRGFQATFGWMNEAKEMPRAVFDMLDARVGRYPRKADGGATFAGVIGDYNAPDTDHWLYTLEQMAAAGELPDYEFFAQPGGVLRDGEGWRVNERAENIHNLPDNYYQRLIQGRDADWIRVNLANEFGAVYDGKPVHPDYSTQLHEGSVEVRRGRPAVVGMDFGLTPAAVFLQEQEFGRWIAFDEIVLEDADAADLAGEIKRRMADYPGLQWDFIGDPAGDERSQGDREQTVFRVLRANGIPARPAPTNDPVARRGAMAGVLKRLRGGKPCLTVGPKCAVLRKGMAGGFQYKRVQVGGSERYRDKPDKNRFSHVVEAAEYGLLGSGERPEVAQSQLRAASQPIVHTSDWSPYD